MPPAVSKARSALLDSWPRTIAGVLAAVAILSGIILGVSFWNELPGAKTIREGIAVERYCTTFVDRHGQYLASACPTGGDLGEFTSIDSISPQLIRDLEFFEDASFEHHIGVSPSGLLRALAGHGGGSTITQQVARSLMIFKEHTIYRKAAEVVCAMKLELYFSKRQILELYFNHSRFGQGPRVGIAYAARHYFSKTPSALTRAEGLLLVSFLSRPVRAARNHEDERIRVYQARVRRLYESGEISDSMFAKLNEAPALVGRDADGRDFAGLFVAQAERELAQLAERLPPNAVNGAIVETTLDTSVNNVVGRALGEALHCCASAHASAVLLNSRAEVIAYTLGQVTVPGDQDLVAAGATMPASQMKVPVYAAFIDSLLKSGLKPSEILGYHLPSTYRLTPSRTIRDKDAPQNLTLHDAVVRSMNAPVYFLSNDFFTPVEVARYGARLGLVLPPIRSVGIGQSGVSQLALVTAYTAILLRDGHYRRPVIVRRVYSRGGDTLRFDSDASEPETASVVSVEASMILKQLLREVVSRSEGTAHPLLTTHPEIAEYDVAAKTGTSSGSAWGFRGVTGTLGESATFSVLIQGTNLPAARTIAAPAAARVIAALANRERNALK